MTPKKKGWTVAVVVWLIAMFFLSARPDGGHERMLHDANPLASMLGAGFGAAILAYVAGRIAYGVSAKHGMFGGSDKK